MGKKKTTKILQKTLFPEFYETVVFDDVSFSKENNFEYAPLAALRVFDKVCLSMMKFLSFFFLFTSIFVGHCPQSDS